MTKFGGETPSIRHIGGEGKLGVGDTLLHDDVPWCLCSSSFWLQPLKSSWQFHEVIKIALVLEPWVHSGHNKWVVWLNANQLSVANWSSFWGDQLKTFRCVEGAFSLTFYNGNSPFIGILWFYACQPSTKHIKELVLFFFGKLLRIPQGLLFSEYIFTTSWRKNNIFLSPLGICLQTLTDLDKPWDFSSEIPGIKFDLTPFDLRIWREEHALDLTKNGHMEWNVW